MEFKEYILEECIDLIIDHRGKTPKKMGGDWIESGIPVVSAKNVKGGSLKSIDAIRFVSEEVYNRWMKEPLKKGDILLASEGATLGENMMWDFDGKVALGQRLYGIRTNPNILYDKYFAQYINSAKYQNEIYSKSTGTSVLGIKQSELLKTKLILPNIEAQKIIGDIGYAIQKKLEFNINIIKNCKEICSALFEEWFVKFNFTNEQGLPYCSSGGEMVESELGKIPKGFGVLKADELFNINIGKTPPRKETHHFSTSEGKKWVSISDMKSIEPFIINTKEYLTLNAIDKYNVKVVPSNTVILSFKLTVGRIAITIEDMLTNEAIAHFNIKNSNVITTEYTYLYLKEFNYEKLGSTSSIATAVNSKIVKTIPFLVPSQEILFNFSKKVSPLFELIKIRQIENQKLIEIRESLLPKLLSGEIEIPDESVVEPS